MVRDNKKEYAEPNDENTVVTNTLDLLSNDNLIIGGNEDLKMVVHGIDIKNAIFYIKDNQLKILEIEPNKKLGSDNNGNLLWI